MNYDWVKCLCEIEKLVEGWDGDSAQPIFPSTIEFARQVIPLVGAEFDPEVGAVMDGSLDLNWVDMGIYCVVESDIITVHRIQDDAYHIFLLDHRCDNEPQRFVKFLADVRA